MIGRLPRHRPGRRFFATTGVILSAVYALTLYRRVVFGELVKPELKDITDLDGREIADLRAADRCDHLVSASIRRPILDAFAAPTEALVKNYQAALTAAKTAVAAVQ